MKINITFLFVFFNFWISGQSYSNYNTFDGLPSNQVYDIVQNIDDVIWVATDNGVSAYDGYQFKNYNLSDGLSDLTVFSMQSTENGRMYFQTLSGKIFYKDLGQDTIVPYKYNSLILNKWIFISDNFRFCKDTLFYGLTYQGLLKIDPEGKSELKVLPEEYLGVFEVENQSIPFFNVNQSQKGADKTKVKIFDSHGLKKVITLPEVELKNSSYLSKRISIDKNFELIFHNKYLYISKNNRIIFNKMMDGILDITKFENKIIFHLNNDLGVKVYNSLEDIMIDQFQTYLEESTISDIYSDKDGGFWLASLNKGIYYYRSANAFFNSTPEVLNFNILSICQKNSNEVYLGSESKGLFLYDIKDRKVKKLLNVKFGIYSMKSLDDDDLLCATTNGTFIYLAKDNKFIKAYSDHLLPISSLNGIGINPDNTSLMINAFFGFGMIDKKSRKVIYVGWQKQKEEGFYNRVFSSVKDQYGVMWVGKPDGLYRVIDKKVEKFSNDKRLSARVECIVATLDSSLVVGTKGQGIIKIKDGKVVESFAPQLSSLIVVKVKAFDNDIWVSASEGMYRVKDNGGFDKITTNQGLSSNRINDWEIINNYLFTVSFKGLNLLYLKDLESSTENIPQIISVKNITTNKISNLFNYKENDIAITFKTIDFKQAGKVFYRYRINSNSVWNETKERQVNLLNLPGGNYDFEVQSKDENNKWSESSISSFKILFPFYTRWYFIGFLFFLISFLAYRIYSSRIKRIQNKFALEQHVKNLEVAALQAQMNPHFIFNCLNSIQKYILTQDKEKAANYLSMFSRLIRKVLDASKEGQITLEDEIQFLSSYLELEQMRFKQKFNFTISIASELDLKSIKIQPLLIQPIVENAVIHAMDKITGQGLIEIEVIKNEKKDIILRVKDNGPGIDEAYKIDFGHNPVGLSNVRDRISLKNNTKQGFNIETLYNINGDIQGTLVEIKL